MPSFDIVSKVNSMEVENAVSQAQKELATRFDFKGSKAEIKLEKHEIKLTAPDAYKMKTLVEIVLGKLAKRGISMKSVDEGEADLSPLGHARQTVKIKEGIEATVAKQITAFIRDGKFKVTSSEAYQTARYCLIDTLGCGFEALDYPACTKLLGPVVPGATLKNGARVPGTRFQLDPVQAAFNIGTIIRWLDFNDTWLAAEWGHPSDNLGGILAVADYLSRNGKTLTIAGGKKLSEATNTPPAKPAASRPAPR